MIFKDKTIMITGANKGIGKAIADHFYNEGAFLSLGIRNPDSFIHNYDSTRVAVIKVDVSIESELGNFYQSTIKNFNNIHVLVNNAGIDSPCSLLDITADHLRSIMEVNFISMVLLTKIVAKHMINNKYGRIINISSIAGKEGTPYHIAYTASKHAVIGFTKSVARELIDYGITVNAVCPGLIKTDMLINFFIEYSKQIHGDDKEELQKMIQRTPRRVVGSPEDVANLVAFLSCDKASNIVGQAINTDGGYLQF